MHFSSLQCSVSCGEGTRRRSVDCRFANGQLSLGCDKKKRPATKEACNIRPCPTWMTGDWGSVSYPSGAISQHINLVMSEIICAY